MSEKKYYWLKLKDDFFRDKKIKKLRRIAGGDTFTIIYLKMQLLSIKNGGMLHFDGVESDLAKELALDLDEDVENLRMTIAFLRSNDLIEECENDDYLLPEAARAIGSEAASAERVRKLRSRQVKTVEALQCNASALQCNSDVTNCNGDVTKCNTDIDIDIDIDIDKDIEFNEPHTARKGVARFSKPTIEEVQAYCKERRNSVDAERFISFYESKGWKVGKNPMKDWKAAIRTWERLMSKTESATTYSSFDANEFYSAALKKSVMK